MLSFVSAPDHVLAVRITGKFDAADFDKVAERLDEILATHRRVAVYAEVDRLDSVTPEAMWHDLRYGASHLKYLPRFYRAALVTDIGWMRNLAKWEDWMIPNVDVKVFPLSERAAAMDWISVEPPRRMPGLEELSSPKPNILAWAVKGDVTAEDIEQVTPRIKAAVVEHGQIRLLLRMDRMPGFNIGAIREKAGMFYELSRIERTAVVGGADWFETTIEMMEPLLRTQLRHFDRDEEAEAWAWLEAATPGTV